MILLRLRRIKLFFVFLSTQRRPAFRNSPLQKLQQTILKLRRCPHSVAATSQLCLLSRNPFPRLKLIRCPRFDSCAPAHLKLVRVPRSLAATLAAWPSMSLFPKAPFDLSVCPSMLLASPRLHSRSCPRRFAFYVAHPIRS